MKKRHKKTMSLQELNLTVYEMKDELHYLRHLIVDINQYLLCLVTKPKQSKKEMTNRITEMGIRSLWGSEKYNSKAQILSKAELNRLAVKTHGDVKKLTPAQKRSSAKLAEAATRARSNAGRWASISKL